LLAFAENALINAASLWLSSTLAGQAGRSTGVLPSRVRFDGSEFGNVVTCLPFEYLRDSESGESRAAYLAFVSATAGARHWPHPRGLGQARGARPVPGVGSVCRRVGPQLTL
jgi:hypothetical protein